MVSMYFDMESNPFEEPYKLLNLFGFLKIIPSKMRSPPLQLGLNTPLLCKKVGRSFATKKPRHFVALIYSNHLVRDSYVRIGLYGMPGDDRGDFKIWAGPIYLLSLGLI